MLNRQCNANSTMHRWEVVFAHISKKRGGAVRAKYNVKEGQSGRDTDQIYLTSRDPPHKKHGGAGGKKMKASERRIAGRRERERP